MNNEFTDIRNFIDKNFKHFNASVVKRASKAYIDHLKNGGKMFLTLAGAMSTAELGITLAQIIRQNKVHAISCTGANLEEDIFNLVAHNHYEMVPDYRTLTPLQEKSLHDKGMNRVTDTCIPEEQALRKIERLLIKIWTNADKENKRYFPHEFIYQLIRDGINKQDYQIDPKNSWIIAACEKNLPIFVPGWEDSTLGNIFVSNVIKKNISSFNIVKSGLEYMNSLIDWYKENSKIIGPGFFQIGGGIAGDFPICVVPLLQQDLKIKCNLWGYFCQISDSTTSYGSYSGATPTEKITWGKLDVNTPMFVIESDATIIAPLMFAYILSE